MKKTIRIVHKKDAGFDVNYWSSKTPAKRLEALEKLRSQILFNNGVRQEFQRVFRIVARS
jgi:hypothetical protein